MNILINWLLSSLALLVASYVLPGVHVEGFFTAMVVVVILALVNAIIRPIMVLLTLPITLVTLGLFMLVINALMVLLVDWIVPGFVVDSFWWALLFSVVLWLINLVVGKSKTHLQG
jgi:putative membrane protein